MGKKIIKHGGGDYALCGPGKKPIDEICTCGKLKSQHSPLVVDTGNAVFVEAGGGDGVNCSQFTWAGFVYDENDPRPPAKGRGAQ